MTPAQTRRSTSVIQSLPVLSGSALALSLLVPLTMTGCKAVGPDFVKPTVKTPIAYRSLGAGDGQPIKANPSVPTPEVLATWWKQFNDPALNSLMERAVNQNIDLKVAAERVREARALRGVADSARFPELNSNGSIGRSRQSSNTGQPGLGNKDNNLFEAGLDASWEIDVFGGVRRGVEAADNDLLASQEDQRAVLVSVLSEIARNYIELRGFQQRAAVAERTIKAQGETVSLTTSRLDAGIANELEVSQSKAQLATREAAIPLFRLGERQAIYRLSVLLGSEPGSLVEELSAVGPIPALPPEISVGLPADLLRRRPDIRAAERRIAAATARIGVATSDLYPKFSLNGTFGLQSEEADKFFNMDSRFWSIGPRAQWSIFNAGRVRQNIAAASSREKQQLLSFEQNVLTALEDVENSLTSLSFEQQRLTILNRATDANRRSLELATDRYRNGLGDFLNVLDSQKALFDSEDQLVQSQTSVARSVISLYKALGGGWTEVEQPSTPTTQSPAQTQPQDPTPVTTPVTPQESPAAK